MKLTTKIGKKLALLECQSEYWHCFVQLDVFCDLTSDCYCQATKTNVI
jgi:hypothetical protein